MANAKSIAINGNKQKAKKNSSTKLNQISKSPDMSQKMPYGILRATLNKTQEVEPTQINTVNNSTKRNDLISKKFGVQNSEAKKKYRTQSHDHQIKGIKRTTDSVFNRLFEESVSYIHTHFIQKSAKRQRDFSLKQLMHQVDSKIATGETAQPGNNEMNGLKRIKNSSKTRSHAHFYEDQLNFEDKRKQKMMLLIIDKEKKEISELTKSVHNA